VERATRLLNRKNAACLVREDGRLAGILTRYDVVRTLTQAPS
jgi:predicted transcriptional regulator